MPPADQLFFVSKPFHATEIQQLVLALAARWRGERWQFGGGRSRAGGLPEVLDRLRDADEREHARLAAEEKRRKREADEIAHWKNEAEKRIAPSVSHEIQTDPVDSFGMRGGAGSYAIEQDTQMRVHDVAEEATQTRQAVLVLDDPKDLREIFEIKRQTEAGVPILEAIRGTSLDRGDIGSPSPRRRRWRWQG